jgi:hypothetical protein
VGFEVKKDLPTLGFEVFDILCLVKDHIVPFLATKDGMVSYSYFIACYAYMERVQLGPSFSLLLSFFRRPKVSHDLEGRAPSFELYLPVHKDSCGHNDQMRSPYTLLNGQMSQQSNRLNSLPKPHLISQDTVHVPIV